LAKFNQFIFIFVHRYVSGKISMKLLLGTKWYIQTYIFMLLLDRETNAG